MKPKFDYTAATRRFSFHHPLLSAVITQIIFWCVSFTVLGIITQLTFKGVSSMFSFAAESKFTPVLIISLIMGLFYGSMLGITDFFILRKWSMGKSLGRQILVNMLVYFISMNILFAFVYAFWQVILLPSYFHTHFKLDDNLWRYYFYVIAVFTLFMNTFISFIIQINKKFGPGVLLPFILGKYTNPQIEERAFIFLDLKSSTTHAEKLGHKKYSQLIRDCFLDINHVSTKYNAEIYQYVGDEMVLSWLANENLNIRECFDFYFDCQHAFENRTSYYQNEYGLVPEFKAGLHIGIVTCVEVGDVKREIAYHGDTLNVTSRIQAKCNENNADIIFTSSVKDKINAIPYAFEEIGHVFLKGKMKPVFIYKIKDS